MAEALPEAAVPPAIAADRQAEEAADRQAAEAADRQAAEEVTASDDQCCADPARK